MKKKLLSVVLAVVMLVSLLVPALAANAAAPTATISLTNPVEVTKDNVQVIAMDVVITDNAGAFFTANYQVKSLDGVKPYGWDKGSYKETVGSDDVILTYTVNSSTAPLENSEPLAFDGFQVVHTVVGSADGQGGITTEGGSLMTVYFEKPTTSGTYRFELVWLSGTDNETVQYEMTVSPSNPTYTVLNDGWQQVGDTWYYFVGGVASKGWQSISGTWYYFDASGAMVLDWQNLGGTWYYFDASGAMVSDWQYIGGTWYYFDASGAMVSDWQYIGGTWYYFDASGAMVTGWQSLGGTWYYFNDGGAMVTGWQSLGGTWYYFNGGGAMVTGWQDIGGTWYLFDASGAWVG